MNYGKNIKFKKFFKMTYFCINLYQTITFVAKILVNKFKTRMKIEFNAKFSKRHLKQYCIQVFFL